MNDKLGHDFGDAVLTSFARHLLKLSGERDVVTRLGGDEFCVVFRDKTEEDVVHLLESLLDTIQTSPVRHAGEEHHMRTSIGLAPPHSGRQAGRRPEGRRPQALYRQAHRAGPTGFNRLIRRSYCHAALRAAPR
ncbi:GGDEF domain-containing protein [Roseibium salinum]|nr:GGDEF domain-containing protein [Roseibium salinum]